MPESRLSHWLIILSSTSMVEAWSSWYRGKNRSCSFYLLLLIFSKLKLFYFPEFRPSHQLFSLYFFQYIYGGSLEQLIQRKEQELLLPLCVCEELLVETLPFPRIQALKLIIFTLFFPVYQWWKSWAAYPEERKGAVATFVCVCVKNF